MQIELYEPPSAAPHVPAAEVAEAVADARAAQPAFVHRTVALSVSRGGEKTARLRLERLARAVMATDSRVRDPRLVWRQDWAELPLEAFEVLDRGIALAWHTASSRNAMRDAVRSVLRACRDAGILSGDDAAVRLNAMRPEKPVRDPEKQSRGHIPSARVAEVFRELASDRSLTARRDAALIALLVGAGLRRAEAVGLEMSDVDADLESVLVRGKGGVVRDVPLAPGARRAVRAWLRVRGGEPGPLLSPIGKPHPQRALAGTRMSAGTVAQAVAHRFGPEVRPHDLRRTFTGDLLDSGADLSVASKVLGHASPVTTAGYDRRGRAARQAAVEKLAVPFAEAGPTGG